MISFIVSSWNRPLPLLTCISSLLQQDGQNEIIVCDNTPEGANKEEIWVLCEKLKVKFYDTSKQCPPNINAGYKAQNIGARTAKSDWLCFPSDDCYYVPGFAKVMLDAALEMRWELVYCDMLYDPRYNRVASEGVYAVVPVYPRLRFIDKSNFIVRSSKFPRSGFSETHPNGYGDWEMINHLIKEKNIKHGKAPGILMVHN